MAPETIILLTMLLGLTLYAVWGGADFGAGVWEFNTVLEAPPRERNLIYRAIGPVWEANHVWLIFVLVGLFGAFPTAFAGLCRALWLPLFLALLGIVFRGAGYVFRSYAVGEVRLQRAGEAAFAFASTAAPFFLGTAIGAVASGRLRLEHDGGFAGNAWLDWISPLSIFTGFYVVGMCAYLAAVYLARESHLAGEAELVRTWRRRALANGLWMGILSLGGLGLVWSEVPELWSGMLAVGWPLVVLSLVGGFVSLAALWAGRYHLATVGSMTAVAAVIWAWGLGQYPALVPPSVTVASAKAPENVLWLMAGSIGVGAVLLLPSLGWLIWLFKAAPPDGTHRDERPAA